MTMVYNRLPVNFLLSQNPSIKYDDSRLILRNVMRAAYCR